MYNTLLDELFDLNREMNRLFDSARVGRAAVYPETNVYENKDSYVIVAKVPGMEKDAIDISFKDNTLTISGERQRDSKDLGKAHLEERFTGKFSRNFLLKEKIDIENIKAESENGLLMIKLPKSPEAKPKKISIN